MHSDNQMFELISELKLPVVVAPMFLISGPQMVIAASKAGVIGAMPAPNARTIDDLSVHLDCIVSELGASARDDHASFPWMLNMIVHSSYDRFSQELELVMHYKPPIVSTALGNPRRVLDEVHSYGGIVLADVTSIDMARKSVNAGVDALVLVCSGAGGHTGTFSPFAFIAEVRKFWSGPLAVAGCISTGVDIHAAKVMGADFVVMGTRFIVADESLVDHQYREMLIDCSIEEIEATTAVSGVLANWMRPSLERAGIDVAGGDSTSIDFSGDIASRNKAWKDVWGAGQGVGRIAVRDTVSSIVDELKTDFGKSLERWSLV